MESSYPWAGRTIGDAGPYSDTQWDKAWELLFGAANIRDGALRNSGNGTNFPLLVAAQAAPNKTVRVFSGAAIVSGKFYRSTATENLTIDDNVSGNPRIDSIILRSDYAAQTIRLAVKQGTPAVTPAAPTMSQVEGTLYEVRLADIAVADSFTTITDSEITNTATVPAMADVQIFTADDTWVKPDGAKLIEFFLIAGGGGGGSGRRGAAGSNRGGGGGGSGGGLVSGILPASMFADSVAVAIGQGGAGGAAIASDNTNGNAGADGGNTLLPVAGFSGDLRAVGGKAGGGGTTAGGAGGGLIVSLINLNVERNGVSAPAGAVTAPVAGAGNTSSLMLPTPGGSGAGLDTANTEHNGGGPGGKGSTSANQSGWDQTPGPLADYSDIPIGGRGGGSGQVGVAAGDGFTYGGGGGGGAAALNGTSALKAGDGADGVAYIITHF